MTDRRVQLFQIAYARSGDKGSNANVGIIAYTPAGHEMLRDRLSAAVVERFFQPMGLRRVVRYELPNLGALNFVLEGILDGGGSRSLRIDAQGKALGQALLELELDVPADRLADCLPPTLGAPRLGQARQEVSRG